LIAEHGVEAIVHFRPVIVVPESVTDPLGYYLNTPPRSRSLIEAAVRGGVRRFIFSSTAAVYGNGRREPVRKPRPGTDVALWRSKLMTRVDARRHRRGARFPLTPHCVIFNVAGSRPKGRTASR